MRQAATLPVANAIQFFVKNFHLGSTPLTGITDAVMTGTIYDEDGNAVSGGSASLTHSSNGDYSGVCSPTLTAGEKYKVVITCSNYTYRVERWFYASNRNFENR